MIYRLHALLLSLWLALAPIAAEASQNSLSSPTVGTVSGLQITNNYNNALDSLNTANSGGTAPTNQLSGTPSLGNTWLDTSVTPNRLKVYDGAQWVIAGLIDTANHYWVPVTGGGTVQSIASATTTDLCSGSQNYPTYVSITGNTTITGFGSNCQVGQVKLGVFASNPAPSLTYNAASFILPTGGAAYAASQGDTFAAVYLGSGNWKFLYVQPVSGGAVTPTANFTGAVFVNSVIAPAALSASQNNWSPTGLAAANVVRITTTAQVNITGIAAPATNGQRILLVNDNPTGQSACSGGTNCNVQLTANDSASSAANRLCLPRLYRLAPQKEVVLVYGTAGSGFTNSCWRLESAYSPTPLSGNFVNAKIVNGGTPNNQLTYTADWLVVADANFETYSIAGLNCTADITTSGAGGLDTGTVAQGQGYYLWIIYSPSTATASCMFSTASAIGGTVLPSGYTMAARVGWDFVENAAGKRLNRILCYGRSCQYVVTASSATATLPTMASGTQGSSCSSTSATYASVSVTGFVPPTASRIRFAASPINNPSNYLVAPNNSYGGRANTSNPPPISITTTSGVTPSAESGDFALESTNIYGCTDGVNALLQALGWEDNL